MIIFIHDEFICGPIVKTTDNCKYMHAKIILLFISASLLVCCSKSSDKSSSALPSAGSSAVSVQRQDTNSTLRININLNTSPTSDVSMDYTTADGSAKGGKDFKVASGKIIIPAGMKTGYVDLLILGDSLRQPQQQFSLELSNPVNCTFSNSKVNISILNDGTYLPTDTSGYSSPLSYPGYTLQWSDEFNDRTVNAGNWKFETGTGNSGWGNNELENYTSRQQNVFVSDGMLVIEARQESYSGSNYTSARMISQGLQEFQYGHIDIRAKLPVAKGMWPAIWMLGSNISQVSWPACGEIDIMELVGQYPARCTSTLHWANNAGDDTYKNKDYSLPGGDFSQQFHVFSADWQKDTVSFSVDGNPFLTISNSDIAPYNNPFNSPFFFIMNVAVGGNWPGPPDNTTAFPQRMFVDYVRVFAKQ